jgi:hypothetical protein
MTVFSVSRLAAAPAEPLFNERGTSMSKSHDSKKNVKKPPTRTPQEKREAKRIKKAQKNG